MLNCIVKNDLLHNPVMKNSILACGFLPNDESLQVIEDADAILRSGQSMLIFPEGTRTGWDNKICFNRGQIAAVNTLCVKRCFYICKHHSMPSMAGDGGEASACRFLVPVC